MVKHKKKEKQKLTSSIITLFKYSGSKKLNYKQISAKLLIDKPHERMLIQSILNQLVQQKTIIEIGKGKFQATPKEKIEIEGIIDMTRNGTGYIASDLFNSDIFIAPRNTGKAMINDRVLVEVDQNKRKPEGRVVKIIERNRDTFVGLVELSKHHAFVIPDDFKVSTDFFIPLDQLNGAKDGDKVIIKITGWPEKANNPIAKVENVLGPSGNHQVEMHAILYEFGLPFEFPENVKKASASIAEGIDDKEISKRWDFRKTTTFTIDPVDAKDFDDALSVEFLENGKYRIGVHIADVSHYVRPGSVIDKEAYERSTSVYLVDRVVPMLPEILSNVVCSLRPNEDKLTYSAVFEMDNNAKIEKVWIGRTVIHSDRRFTYDQAQKIIEEGEGDYKKEVLLLDKLAKLLRKKRYSQGAIDFGGVEVRFKLDDKGFPIGINKKEMKDSNRLIEEFMLLANQHVAKSVGKVSKPQTPKPFVYRIHDKPDPQKLEQLGNYVAKFGYRIDKINGKNAAGAINKLMHAAKGQPEEDLIATMAIRSMAKAVYSTHNIGHYGLAFDYYSHFTSPIRRYPDLEVHRLLSAYQHGKTFSNNYQLEEMCKHASLNEKRATNAERTSIKYKQVEYLSKRIGQVFDGIISSLTSWGIYVEILDGLCEGMISINSLKDDNYYFDDKEFVVKGGIHKHEYNMGDKVSIKVKSTDIYRRQIDFEMIE